MDFKKYEERTQGFTVAEDVVSGKKHGTNFTIPAKKLWVLSLKN
ncbi:MAG: cyclomaltodextrinase C-terminal domain-containing protein [Chitinophagaceae bacterium]